jgi:nucleotide-binding universal stress UspA family protein
MADTVLVALDFGPATARVIEEAKSLAKDLDASVELLHVVGLLLDTSPGLGAITSPELRHAILEAASRALDEAAQNYGVTARPLAIGDPATEILRVVQEEEPRLVVVGTHGRRGVVRMLLGSVSERVLGESEAPVVVVHPRALGQAPAGSAGVLVFVDLDEDATHAIDKAREMANKLGVDVQIAHVHPGSAGTRAASEAAVALAELARASGDLAFEIMHGDPTDAILQSIDAHAPRLVVMGAPHRRGRGRFSLGEVTAHVVRASSAPVLVVHPAP